MVSRWGAIGALLAGSLMLSACNGTSDPVEPEPDPSVVATDTTAQAVQKADVDGHVTVTVRGDQNFDWSGTQKLRILRAGGPGLAVNLLSVGMVVPQALDEPRDSFRWAFDLLAAYADKPGSYTLPIRQEGAEGAQSAAFVFFIRAKERVSLPPMNDSDVEAFLQYRELLEPCVVTVGDRLQNQGSLNCPALATEDGRKVSLVATWDVPES